MILDENQLEDACEHLAEYLEVYWRATHHPPHAPHAVPSPTGLPGLQVPPAPPSLLPELSGMGGPRPGLSPQLRPSVRLCQQSQQLLGERGEHSPLEHDSLMPSDEAGETSPQPWGATSQRSSRHMEEEEEEYGDPYPDLYQPHRHHNSGMQGPERQPQRNPDRNWQRSRPWAKDSY